jgi:hypothetical protein
MSMSGDENAPSGDIGFLPLKILRRNANTVSKSGRPTTRNGMTKR